MALALSRGGVSGINRGGGAGVLRGCAVHREGFERDGLLGQSGEGGVGQDAGVLRGVAGGGDADDGLVEGLGAACTSGWASARSRTAPVPARVM